MHFSTLGMTKRSDIGKKLEGETLKKCQRVMLGITEDFISMCEQEGIFYELGGGSCLGAVREKGFIPWDDDMDVNVLSKDFEKIPELMTKHYGDKYSFMDYREPKFQWTFGRILLNNTLFKSFMDPYSDNRGFFIDLFIIENVPDNPILRTLHGIVSMMAGGILSCRKFYENRAIYRKLCENNPEMRGIARFKIFAGWFISFIPMTTCNKITQAIYSLCKNENSKYVSIPGGRGHYFGEMHTREGLTETITAEFEGHHWQIPKDYHAYLNALYGQSYMTPPHQKCVNIISFLRSNSRTAAQNKFSAITFRKYRKQGTKINNLCPAFLVRKAVNE